MLSRSFLLSVALLLTAAVPAHAEQFMSPFARSDWQVERSRISCRLRQVVPRYGEGVFETRAGGRQSFTLRTKQNPMVEGPTALVAAPPPWNPTRAAVDLGTHDIDSGSEPLRLAGDASQQLLDSLDDGLMPQFSRPLQSNRLEEASLGLSPLNFRPAYRQYRDCIKQMVSVSYEQIVNTTLIFSPERTELSAQAQQKIDAMLRYALADRAVKGFTLQAVSADTPRRLENLQLSKERAQQVHEYLLSKGIAAAKISSDYRGERGGKGDVRTVTIRLNRVE
ncbi:MAG: hypothetical protein JWM78_1601 [Verrucomicrobiaceae bacterium]|nr:hypothetical protein [Verrucomicrobiaceae bacterium]